VIQNCQVQSLACFDANITVIRNGISQETGFSEDLPLPGYLNHWHYVLTHSPGSNLSSLDTYIGVDTDSQTCAAAVIWPEGRGGMYMEAIGNWRLELHPIDDNVAAQFAALAGAIECRFQSFTVNILPDGKREIVISELE
jgi:hypothetical protein